MYTQSIDENSSFHLRIYMQQKDDYPHLALEVFLVSVNIMR